MSVSLDVLSDLQPIKQLGHGITLMDTAFQRPQMAACYVMRHGNEVVIIETGTKDTVPLVLNYFKQVGISTDQVKYIIVTHVHLDHAGGAGRLMEACSNAKLVVHPKGKRHMVDPSKLQAGATAVYGEDAFQKTYGDLLPISEDRIIAPEDSETLQLEGRALLFIDTPGHARHHFCVYDELSRGFFTGDTFGLAYEEFTNHNGPFIFPTTTPVQFDPEAMKHSIQRMVDMNPEQLFLTHYGRVSDPVALAKQLYEQIDVLVELAQSSSELSGQERIKELNQKIMDFLLSRLERHESELPIAKQIELLKTDVLLNAQGLDVWLG